LDPLRQRVAEGQVVGRGKDVRGAPGTRHDRRGGGDGEHDAKAAHGQSSPRPTIGPRPPRPTPVGRPSARADLTRPAARSRPAGLSSRRPAVTLRVLTECPHEFEPVPTPPRPTAPTCAAAASRVAGGRGAAKVSPEPAMGSWVGADPGGPG